MPAIAGKGAGASPAAATLVPAEEQRLEQLRGRVASAVRRVCPAWMARQADDIAQNVLIRLAALPRSGEEERQFSSMYLTKAAYGATVDEIRRIGRRREVPLPEGDGLADVTPAPAPDPEREAASAEIGCGIQHCLQALIQPRRLAVTLFLQGCSVPEGARRLGWTAKRTENLVYRGLAELRGCLVRKGLTP